MAETEKDPAAAEGARAYGEEEEEQETATLQGDSSGFLLQLWERVKGGNSFSDVTLEFKEEQSLPSHSIILISMSPFFEAALTTEMVEKHRGVIKLPTTTLVTFTLALAYTLGQEVKVRVGKQLEQLLELGEMLQLWTLTEVVGQVLADRLTPHSCLETLQLVHKYRLQKVKAEVESFVAGRLLTASRREEWARLLEEEVSGVIQASRQTSQSADVTAKALLSWLEKTSASSDCASRLLGLIPLDALSDDFLCSSLLFHPSVCPCAEFVQTVKETMLARVSSGGRRSVESPPSPPLSRLAATKPVADEVVMAEEGPTPVALYFLACNAHGNSKYNHMFVWEERDQIWKEYPAPPVGFDMCPTLLERDVLLVTSSDSCYSPKVTESKRFSLQRREWTEGNRLNRARTNHGVATAFNTAYAVGGFGRDGCSVKPIEAYQSLWGEWREVGFLEVGLRNPGVASAGDLILAVGGQGDCSQSHLIQVFNTLTRATAIATAKLPVMMNFVRFAGKRGGGLYFLSSRGDLVKLVQDGAQFRVDRHVRMDFTPRAHFAVTCERDGVVVYGGTLEFPGEALVRSCGTQAFDYSGRLKMSEPRVLPRAFLECQVVPVFELGILTGWGLLPSLS